MQNYYDKISEQIKIIMFSGLPAEFNIGFVNRAIVDRYPTIMDLNSALHSAKSYLIFIGGENKLTERRRTESAIWHIVTGKNHEGRSDIKKFIIDKYNPIDGKLVSLAGSNTANYIFSCIKYRLKTNELIELIKIFGNGDTVDSIIKKYHGDDLDRVDWSLPLGYDL